MTQTQTRSPAPLATADKNPDGDVSAAIERALIAASNLLTDERARHLALSERWRARRFVTIIAGEFKRGKSTPLNALAGVDVLPTGVLPVTTVPTRALARSIAGKTARLVGQELALVEIVASPRTSGQLRGLVAAFADRRATAEARPSRGGAHLRAAVRSHLRRLHGTGRRRLACAPGELGRPDRHAPGRRGRPFSCCRLEGAARRASADRGGRVRLPRPSAGRRGA